ncbi:MAG: hypothetical protein Q4E16_00395 [Neisseria sp.]|nr:hypothetical protein [Neisseria sp.]
MNTLKLYPIVSLVLNNNIAEQEIPKLWQQTALPCAQTIYGVYSEYQSDANGDYRFSIATEIPNGSEPIVIEHLSTYQTFPSQREQILATWQSIWQQEQEGILARAYSIDFERYTESETNIFIAVQSKR